MRVLEDELLHPGEPVTFYLPLGILFTAAAFIVVPRTDVGLTGGENLSPPSGWPGNHSDEPSISGQSLIYFPAHTDTAERLDGTSLNIINYSSTRD
ncbi:hypothetical protein AV530_013788 [Patagioenas fasciata monilis]|uniref:Uncharacterized protein n=1 Tax=Patagioenas fasciata monilis TaxID=372326 RepID=A0A1V4J869_PATFA|nr:hypothetical protein AV530_013788 [Patagioenas fasciata monilis]